MRKILKSKKGIAIESAILFMLVIMSVSILLTSVVMSAHTGVRIGKNEMENRLKLEQLGDAFVAYIPVVNDTFEELDDELSNMADQISEGADAEISADGSVLTVKNRAEKTILYIEKSGTQVITWRYSAPDTTTQE